MPSKRIPISAAKAIAAAHGQRQVIVLAWDGATTHVVTYGVTQADCERAAQGGNKLKAHLGWPSEMCGAAPARGRKERA